MSKEQIRKQRLLQLANDSDLAIFEHVNDLEDKVEETISKFETAISGVKDRSTTELELATKIASNLLQDIKGDDYVITKEDIKEISELAVESIDTKEIAEEAKNLISLDEIALSASKLVPVPKAGKDGKDGKDGQDGLDGLNAVITDDIIKEVTLGVISQLPEGIEESGETIINKINDVDDKGVKIDAKHIKNLPEFTQNIIQEGFSVGSYETPIKAGNNVTVTKNASGAYVIGASASAIDASVSLTKSGTQAISTNTATAITWDTEIYDTKDYHDNTNPSRITVPEDGKYHFSANIETTASSVLQVYFRKNGTTKMTEVIGGSANPQAVSISGTFVLVATDYLEVIVNNVSAGGNVAITSTFDCFKYSGSLTGNLPASYVGYGGTNNQVTGEAAFAYDASGDLLYVRNIGSDSDLRIGASVGVTYIAGETLNIQPNTSGNMNGVVIGATSPRDATFTNVIVSNLSVGGATQFATLAVASLPAGGSIGTAATTVDIYSSFTINQTDTNQTLTLPTPTSTTTGRIAYVQNIGTARFLMYSSTIEAGRGRTFIWNGTAWSAEGDAVGQNTFTKAKAADESRTSNIVLASDADLTFIIGAGETWVVTYQVTTNSGAGGYKFAIKTTTNLPVASLFQLDQLNTGTQASSINNTNTVGTAPTVGIGAAGATTNTPWLLILTITAGASGGPVTLMWAQSTSNGTASVLRRGSFMTANKVTGS